MKVAVIGSGGREHAIIKKIKENKKIDILYALPGNGGISEDAICVDIKATDLNGILDFCLKEKIDYVIVGPDDPLVMGLVDLLEDNNITCFGPRKDAAIIEGSKVFSKQLMKKYNIPTAEYEVFDNYDNAINYLKTAKIPTVVKADGLALGKGVSVCFTREEAYDAVKNIMQDKAFGKSGDKIVIEEFMQGPEVSCLCFTDGISIIPMVSSMDHKRALDDDKGLNTGGMGTIAPNPYFTEDIKRECMKKIFLPTINAMKKENRVFKGCLFFGLMLTNDGQKVIEYNARFGDPETQVVLPLLETDLFEIMQKVSFSNLIDINVKFKDEYACCVVMASKGYPKEYKKGYEITIDKDVKDRVYVAGAIKKDDKLLTSSGRVLGLVSVEKTLKKAIEKTYKDIEKINFKDSFYRKDIGKKALNVKGV